MNYEIKVKGIYTTSDLDKATLIRVFCEFFGFKVVIKKR